MSRRGRIDKLLDPTNKPDVAGFYKKVGQDILRFDLASGGDVPAGGKADTIVGPQPEKARSRAAEAAARSHQSAGPDPVGIHCNSLHHVALHLADIADSAREGDLAMRRGFGMQQRPFELWRDAGWQQVAEWVKADIDAGKALCNAPLPTWVAHLESYLGLV